MKKHIGLLCLLMFCAFSSAFAQGKKPVVQAFDSPTPDERGATRILYWNTEKKAPLGQVAIDYGRPVWKKEYENQALFDGFTKGKVWRFGKDFWTTLDTAMPLKIAGREIPYGQYFLGMQRSADCATWSLAFLDPVKVRKAGLDAFVIDKAPIEFTVPITFEKATESAEKLTIVLMAAKDDIKNVTLKVNWGTLQLTAPIQVAVTM